MRYFLRLRYNGTAFHGWQIQPNAPSVQAEVESALGLITRAKTAVAGCGRTDTGVHANDFFAHFDSEESINVEELRYKLNSILSAHISIEEVFAVTEDSHSRFDATQRSYRYFINFEKNPFVQQTSYYLYNTKLDLGKMNFAASLLLNYDEFSAFEKTGSDNKTSICDVRFAKWFDTKEGAYFEIRADRFLRNMVRSIVGTLLDVGRGKTSIEEFKAIVESGDRSRAGTSAPAHGLFLWEITYPNSIRL